MVMDVKKYLKDTFSTLVKMGFTEELSKKFTNDMHVIGNISIDSWVNRCVSSIEKNEIPSYIKVYDWKIALKIFLDNSLITEEVYNKGMSLERLKFVPFECGNCEYRKKVLGE